MNTRRDYHLVPETSNSSPSALGHIFGSPSMPENTLNIGPLPAINLQIYSSLQYNTQIGARQSPQFRRFSAIFCFRSGRDAVAGPREDEGAWEGEFSHVETRCFEPEREFLEERLSHPLVDRYLFDNNFEKPVYLITGVKIATTDEERESVIAYRLLKVTKGKDKSLEWSTYSKDAVL